MIVVVGSGVSGLTSAVALQQAGHRVEIWTHRKPPDTTSSVAAAFWYPYRANPQHLVQRWGAVSLKKFVGLGADAAAGITVRTAYDFGRVPMPRPWWGEGIESLRPARDEERPPGFDHGWAFEAPVIDMRVYLPYLIRWFEQSGGRFVSRRVHSFAEFAEHRDVEMVVNCAGLGSAELCGDSDLVPIRGQLVRVVNPGLETVSLDEHESDGIAYVVPRGDDVVLGGTAQEYDDDLEARPEDARGILRRCIELAPQLSEADITAHVVGIRPGRYAIRLEPEFAPRGEHPPVVHNYGHGGSGVTLSWGCAGDVVEHVERVLRPRAAATR